MLATNIAIAYIIYNFLFLGLTYFALSEKHNTGALMIRIHYCLPGTKNNMTVL